MKPLSRLIPAVAMGLLLSACPTELPHDAGTGGGGGGDVDGGGAPDAGMPDAGSNERPDAGQADAGENDAGEPDAGENDAGVSPPDAGSPTDAGGNQFGFIGAYLGGVASFRVNAMSGALDAPTGSPAAPGAAIGGLSLHPNERWLYAVDVDASQVLGLQIDATDGRMSALPGFPLTLTGSPRTLAVDPLGRFLFVAISHGTIPLSGAIGVYAIDPLTGALSAVTGSPFASTSEPAAITPDSNGRFVYVSQAEPGIWAYAVGADTGALTEVSGSPFGATAPVVPRGGAMVLHPSGKFLYTARDSLNGFSIDSTSGALSPLPGSPFQANVGGDPGARSLVLTPDGRALYAVAFNNGRLYGFTVDAVSGVLSTVPGSPFTTSPTPYSVAIERSGRFLYVATDLGQLGGFLIDSGTRAVTPLAGQPHPFTGMQPQLVIGGP